MINYLMFLLIFFLKFISPHIITLPVTSYEDYRPNPLMHFINEHYKYHVYLNTFLSRSVFGIYFREESIRSKRGNTSTIYLDDEYRVIDYSTDIQFDNAYVNDLSIYIADEIVANRIFGLALGYHFKNESCSIVHNLYNNKYIEHRQFAFHNIKENMKGYFYIGGVPNNDHKVYKYKSAIKVNPNLPTWGFTLTDVVINNTVYHINKEAILHSAMTRMFTSDDLYELLTTTVLKEFIERDVCRIKERSYQKYLECKEEIKDVYEEEIDFVFGKTVIQFKMKELFDYSRHSLFSTNTPKKIHGFDGVILCVEFINKFNYTVFDYDSKQVEFYSDRIGIFEKNTSDIKNINKIIVIGVIALTLVNCLYLIYVRVNKQL